MLVGMYGQAGMMPKEAMVSSPRRVGAKIIIFSYATMFISSVRPASFAKSCSGVT